MLQFAAMDARQESGLELVSLSEAETINIGRRIGRRLAAGDLVLLLAPFGAGKTHLAKGIAAGLGADPDEVNSPSFVLINEYVAGQERGRMPIYHADLYRIETAHDLATIGLEECFNGDGICLIEWAERAAGALPDERLAVHISETGEKSRRLRLVPHGARYRALVATLAADQNDAAGN
ncbi:MAG: tRNA threonylcarbamoyladenosine biosynthesis protein TsaE [uncultured Chloroflexia bacterium]|uniref:tRNA threonylcarbamoyladenosine biosynthesis protein TsaE n=1 Tax=uncultured Chloroflexia bacterium TaxID=1672391 RepID=A0A6J4IDP2_9CHLR|nr:MAG: tRNA threonylcarbamoyladenosine biosynthesis protein TsaE [uncultured Chloroflexia bacterium]